MTQKEYDDLKDGDVIQRKLTRKLFTIGLDAFKDDYYGTPVIKTTLSYINIFNFNVVKKAVTIDNTRFLELLDKNVKSLLQLIDN